MALLGTHAQATSGRLTNASCCRPPLESPRPARQVGGGAPRGAGALIEAAAAEAWSLYGLGEQRAHRGHARWNVPSSHCRTGPRYPHRRPSAVGVFVAADQRGPSIEPVPARRSPPARLALPRVPLRADRAPRASHCASPLGARAGGRPCRTPVEGARGRWSAGVRRTRGPVPATV